MAGIEAYVDIETTGLSPFNGDVTVVGIYRVDGDDGELIQLVGEEITPQKILDALKDVDTIYTYNGSRFDLPFMDISLGVNLCDYFEHKDLMYDCWRKNLKGGLKAVERRLGIRRELSEVDGYQAVILWWRYQNSGDEKALTTLLAYNREDVVNLQTLRRILWNTGY
jgi:uncharacterized protein YprB with RNaseH-like and TPR domain